MDVVRAGVVREGLAGDLVDPAGIVVEDVSRVLRRHAALAAERQRHPVVQRLQMRDFFLGRVDAIDDRLQDALALVRRHLSPRSMIEGVARS